MRLRIFRILALFFAVGAMLAHAGDESEPPALRMTLKMRGLRTLPVTVNESRDVAATVGAYSATAGVVAGGYLDLSLSYPMVFGGASRRKPETWEDSPTVYANGMQVPIVGGSRIHLERRPDGSAEQTRVSLSGTGFVVGSAFFGGDNAADADLRVRQIGSSFYLRFPSVDYVYDDNQRMGTRLNGVKTPMWFVVPIPEVSFATSVGGIDLCAHIEGLESIWGDLDMMGTRARSALEVLGGRVCAGKQLGQKVGYLRQTIDGGSYRMYGGERDDEITARYRQVTATLSLERVGGTAAGLEVSYARESASGENGSRTGQKVMVGGTVAAW